MAGIGFVLRDLVRRDDLLGVARAYGHSTVISCAPWLFTVLTLAALTLLGPRFTTMDKAMLFRLLIIYNFAFSLVLTAPLLHTATRVFSDSIYRRSVEPTVTHLILLLIAGYGSGIVFAAPFYVFVADLAPGVAVAAVVNYMLVCGIWAVSIFLSAIKDYRTVTMSFLFGLAISFIGCLGLASAYGTSGMLWGFSLGLILLQASLIARILSEFPSVLVSPGEIWREYRQYPIIALGALAYGLGIWIDKWIMWFAPERHKMAGGLIFYPDYDGAMFLAFMTTIPAFAVFTLTAETDFFERYYDYHQGIRRHASLDRIKTTERAVASTLLGAFRNIAVIQGTVTALAILLAPQIISVFGVTTLQISMFRIAALGAYFHVMFMFTTVNLAYFDQQATNLRLHASFLLANALFTWGAAQLGFRFYGYGYFLASLTAFALSATAMAQALTRMRYLTFVTGGSRVKRSR